VTWHYGKPVLVTKRVVRVVGGLRSTLTRECRADCRGSTGRDRR
jgi:hypothetical protein